MSEPTVTYRLDDAVAHVGLNRPAQLNALTPGMLDLLQATLLRAQDERARCILLTGHGRAFCSGADLAEINSGQQPPDLGELLRSHYNPAVQAMADLAIPIVSAINGAAAGAGVSIALAADIVVAARSSYLLLAFANIGLVPDAGATWLIAKSAGRAKTLAMALLGERLSAEEALDAGLVTYVTEDEQLESRAVELAHRLASKPTLALGLIRQQVRHALTQDVSELLDEEARNQQIAGWSNDFREGVDAFRERRPARFSGN